MRLRALPAVGLGLVSLALTTAMSGSASAAAGAGAGAEGPGVGTVTAGTCYSDLDNLDDYRTMSQNFAPILDAYDSDAADDFTLKKTCKVQSIEVVGAYTTENAVDSETVTFYKNQNGKPGKIINSQTKVGTDLGGGSYDIKLKPVKLKKGTYWVSVVANLDADAGGQWYWTNSNTGNGTVAQWQNPRGGWQYGCLSWTEIEQCLGAGPGPDLAFALSK